MRATNFIIANWVMALIAMTPLPSFAEAPEARKVFAIRFPIPTVESGDFSRTQDQLEDLAPRLAEYGLKLDAGESVIWDPTSEMLLAKGTTDMLATLADWVDALPRRKQVTAHAELLAGGGLLGEHLSIIDASAAAAMKDKLTGINGASVTPLTPVTTKSGLPVKLQMPSLLAPDTYLSGWVRPVVRADDKISVLAHWQWTGLRPGELAPCPIYPDNQILPEHLGRILNDGEYLVYHLSSGPGPIGTLLLNYQLITTNGRPGKPSTDPLREAIRPAPRRGLGESVLLPATQFQNMLEDASARVKLHQLSRVEWDIHWVDNHVPENDNPRVADGPYWETGAIKDTKSISLLFDDHMKAGHPARAWTKPLSRNREEILSHGLVASVPAYVSLSARLLEASGQIEVFLMLHERDRANSGFYLTVPLTDGQALVLTRIGQGTPGDPTGSLVIQPKIRMAADAPAR